jgi:maltose alpha-D-glucosyltransferase/alpha-amylase
MGDNVHLGDRNGVRTPMQWTADRNAGFSAADPTQLFLPVITDPVYSYQAVNVEAQEKHPGSLLATMKRLIAARKRSPAFGRGDIEFLRLRNQSVLAFLRRYGDETLLIVANLSARSQPAELPLAAYEGAAPVEMLGGARFPTIGRAPYFLSLGPHTFYWFKLEQRDSRRPARYGIEDTAI